MAHWERIPPAAGVERARRDRSVSPSAICFVALLCLAGAGCHSHSLDRGDGSSTDDADASADGDADGGACGDPYGDASAPFAPCGVDSDCHNGFLVCAPPSQSTTICRDPAADVDSRCPLPVSLADIPLCPETVPVTFNVCNVRYQLPCKVDSDCGPEGFTCANGDCQEQLAKTCARASECPAGWDCYAACACAAALKSCHPPFADSFGCPNCPAVDGG